MSKRNRNRFRDRDRQSYIASDHSPAALPVNSALNLSSNSAVRMSSADGAANQHAAEYKIISADMIRLVVLNVIILAAVLVVYYTNANAGYLERLYEKLF